METAEELQTQEITALQSIYAEDFVTVPPPKAWKGAQRLHEFIINVRYPVQEYANKVWLSLHVKFPKTYPALACPTFTIQKPTRGIGNDHVAKLSSIIHSEAQKCKGSEMVFQIVTFAQEWMSDNVTPPIETSSLAVEMNKRAVDQEKARQQQQAELNRLEAERAQRDAEALSEQIRADAELRRIRNRDRASSTATEVPYRSSSRASNSSARWTGQALDGSEADESEDGDYPTDEEDVMMGLGAGVEIEKFDPQVVVEGVRFEYVRLLMPKRQGFETVYVADPVCDDMRATLPPLEAHVVKFESGYYSSTLGRKKLSQVEAELRKLAAVRHHNLVNIYAVKLAFEPVHLSRRANSHPSTSKKATQGRLVVLSEQFPSLSLADVLSELEIMREDKVSEYLAQLLAALHEVHAADLVHRGINIQCIGLAPKTSSPSSRPFSPPSGKNPRITSSDSSSTIRASTPRSKQVKLGRIGYYTRLLDLQRSNAFTEESGSDDYDEGEIRRRSLGMIGLKEDTDGTALYPYDQCSSSDADLPQSWQSKAVVDSPLMYTRNRDLYALGIVLLKMLLGSDITERFADGHEALQHANLSPVLHRQVVMMLSCGSNSSANSSLSGKAVTSNHHTGKEPPVSCISLLGDLAETSFRTTTKRSPIIPMSNPGPKTPTHGNYSTTSLHTFQVGSPEVDYFRGALAARARQSSRWKEDWEELEMLGKGAFGSVVKARNKVDNRVYAVKKIRLKTVQNDKIYREINALSRLNHRFIVRYYTTWVERSEDTGSAAASDDDSNSGTYSDASSVLTSVPASAHSRGSSSGLSSSGITFDLDDLDDMDGSGTGGASGGGSFPSIHFSTRDGETDTDDDSDSDDSDDSDPSQAAVVESRGRPIPSKADTQQLEHDVFDLTETAGFGLNGFRTPMPHLPVVRTMYIQMEFVERQTLKERIEEGITEDEAWRLFQQIVDALVHIGARGILHRDIKPTNIFIDVQGDIKVGDFGLATSSLAAVDPTDVSPHIVMFDEMTLEVGTRLYIAPEVQSRKRGPRNHSKADLYSLGIVFFEMNYMFSTGAERIVVIEDLRKPSIFFPASWDVKRERQRKIIMWLLQHSPEDRPSASELAESPLLPARLEDEYFKASLKTMVKQDSVHHQALLSALFTEPPKTVRAFLYDAEADNHPEQASLNDVIHEQLSSIFRLHGAIDMEPPLMIPLVNMEEEKGHATFIDKHGDIVILPRDNLVPFARLAARAGHQRIKRYHISNVYRPSTVPGHPKVSKAAVFDIITPDLELGLVASGAEILTMIDELLVSFPNLSSSYEVHISHSTIVDLALQRIPTNLQTQALEIMNQTKSSPSQKRANLLKRGILRSTADEMEVLASCDDNVDNLLMKIEKIAPVFVGSISKAVEEIKDTLTYAGYAGFSRPVYFRPLMLGSFYNHFKDGILFEVVRKNRRTDILAAGGRYDNLISRFSVKPKAESTCAIALQISVEKITSSVVDHQRTAVSALIKEQRSFGFWSPRRCDVYVVSYHRGLLQERLEVVAHLWSHGISADLMYESGLPSIDGESYLETCAREGILFTVVPRPKTARRDQPAFKVKSILKGTETELARHELVTWLQQQIGEQKKADTLTSGAPIFSDHPQPGAVKDTAASSNIQLVLPVDVKKQRKQVKQMFLDRAFERANDIKSAFQGSVPVLAVDVPISAFDAMVRNADWVTDEDQWRHISSIITIQHPSAYAAQIREAIARRKAEGHLYLLMYAVKEEKMQLLTLR